MKLLFAVLAVVAAFTVAATANAAAYQSCNFATTTTGKGPTIIAEIGGASQPALGWCQRATVTFDHVRFYRLNKFAWFNVWRANDFAFNGGRCVFVPRDGSSGKLGFYANYIKPGLLNTLCPAVQTQLPGWLWAKPGTPIPNQG
jgi:hypothetical protein